MRFTEFIREASIFTKPGTYTYGHKVNIAVNNKQIGQKLLSAIKFHIPEFTGDEDLEWVEPVKSTPENEIIPITVGSGNNHRFFKIPNGQVIELIGADKVIQGGLTHAKGQKGSTAENAGDASEPVLSAAVVAKLIKRGQNDVEDIDADDVKNILTQAVSNPNLEFQVEDKNSKVADIIKFTIMVKKPTLNFLSDPNFWEGKMGEILPSVIHYANSGHMDRYADFFYKNGKVDMIHVKSDGVSEAKERKTDIEATVNGRPLKGMNVSLKAGSPHIGQVGGGQIRNPKATGYILNNANDLFGPFGVEITPPAQITDKVEFWVDAYKQAAEQLKEMLSGDDARTEAGIVAKIADFVANHGTSGDPNIKLVSLGKTGISTVHSFKSLKRKLISNNIDLTCEYREGRSKIKKQPRPELRIYDKNGAGAVIYIRYSSTEDELKIWNTVEMKELLKKLTTITHEKRVRDPSDSLSDEPELIEPAPPQQPTQQPAQQLPTQQEPAQQEPVQQKQRLGHLRQGPEQEPETEPTQTPKPGGFFAKYGYPQKYPKQIKEELFSILKNAGIR
jgi:hypothetical protein